MFKKIGLSLVDFVLHLKTYKAKDWAILLGCSIPYMLWSVQVALQFGPKGSLEYVLVERGWFMLTLFITIGLSMHVEARNNPQEK
ncbi:MAG TPA: hypothetical protein VK171_06805 [Fimbriimonas sp.]|nr:hypothetical protein [Fimbriimonas sp.]